MLNERTWNRAHCGNSVDKRLTHLQPTQGRAFHPPARREPPSAFRFPLSTFSSPLPSPVRPLCGRTKGDHSAPAPVCSPYAPGVPFSRISFQPFFFSISAFQLFLLSLPLSPSPCAHCVGARSTAFGLIHSNDPYYLCHRSNYRGILLTINEVVDP